MTAVHSVARALGLEGKSAKDGVMGAPAWNG